MSFSVEQIPESLKQNMILKSIWQKSCSITFDKLRLIKLWHYNFLHEVTQGELVVHHMMAGNVVSIFQELLEIKFPIEKIKTIDQYDGDDDRSMEDNNSSCFNYRKIAGSNILSMHSYGLAIDINPAQNPYVVIDEHKQKVSVHPDIACNFLNRNNLRTGMVEPIVEIFARHGFTEWGGRWNSPIDYHHFQVSRELLSNF